MHVAPPELEGDMSAAETMMPCATANDLSKAFSQHRSATGTLRCLSSCAPARVAGTLLPWPLLHAAFPLDPVEH